MYSSKNAVSFTIFAAYLFALSQSQLLGLPEGASCSNSGGICRRIRNCPIIGNPRESRPQICTFIDRELVVCCPPSKAQEMCILYDRMACNAVDLARRRRDTESEEMSTTTDQYETQSEPINSTTILFEDAGDGGISSNHSVASTEPLTPVSFTSPTTPRTTTEYRYSSSTGATTTLPYPSTEKLNITMSNETYDEWLTRMLPPDSLSRLPDTNNIADTKIVGGMEASARELPYMALIGFGPVTYKEWSCGASIISENFVLSAAHCAENSLLGPARWVRVAELDLSRENTPHRDIAIVSRHIHPGYREPAVYNDIALFRLGTRLVFSSWVQPICLHVADDIFERRGVAAGWGRTDFIGDTSERLLKVDLTLVDTNQCRNLLGRAGRFLPQGVNLDTMICAGEPQGGKDTCTGDSGGPLVIKGGGQCIRTQVGIVSFGRQCAMPNTPGIYTKVSSFVPWIESVVWP